MASQNPLAALAAKQQSAAPQPAQQPQPVQAAPTAPAQQDDSDSGAQSDDQDDSDTQPDEAVSVPLKRLLAALNEKLTALLDGSGIRRSITVPYIHGGNAADHIGTVGKAIQQVGGLGRNLVLSYHHSRGRGWNSGDGHTIAYPSDKLRATTIPKDDEKAAAVVDAAQHYLNGVKKLLGDDAPAVQVAQSQLNLVKKVNGAYMTLYDFLTFFIQWAHDPLAAVAKAHSGTKDGGHSVRPRPPVKKVGK